MVHKMSRIDQTILVNVHRNLRKTYLLSILLFRNKTIRLDGNDLVDTFQNLPYVWKYKNPHKFLFLMQFFSVSIKFSFLKIDISNHNPFIFLMLGFLNSVRSLIIKTIFFSLCMQLCTSLIKVNAFSS